MSNTLPRPKKLPPRWNAVSYIMATHDEDQLNGFAGEHGLERLKHMPPEVRLERLERRERENWEHLCEVIEQAVASTRMSEEERKQAMEEPLPEIVDRRSFATFVATVASRLHRKLITGPEARSLLYAAQLAMQGLKEGDR